MKQQQSTAPQCPMPSAASALKRSWGPATRGSRGLLSLWRTEARAHEDSDPGASTPVSASSAVAMVSTTIVVTSTEAECASC